MPIDLFDDSLESKEAVRVLGLVATGEPADPELVRRAVTVLVDSYVARASVLDLARECRAAQREYFRLRREERPAQEVLVRARELEARLDKALGRAGT